MSTTSQEILQVLARLESALAMRATLLERRRLLLDTYRRTGVRGDPLEWDTSRETLRTNEDTIDALRAALDALRGGPR